MGNKVDKKIEERGDYLCCNDYRKLVSGRVYTYHNLDWNGTVIVITDKESGEVAGTYYKAEVMGVLEHSWNMTNITLYSLDCIKYGRFNKSKLTARRVRTELDYLKNGIGKEMCINVYNPYNRLLKEFSVTETTYDGWIYCNEKERTNKIKRFIETSSYINSFVTRIVSLVNLIETESEMMQVASELPGVKAVLNEIIKREKLAAISGDTSVTGNDIIKGLVTPIPFNKLIEKRDTKLLGIPTFKDEQCNEED